MRILELVTPACKQIAWNISTFVMYQYLLKHTWSMTRRWNKEQVYFCHRWFLRQIALFLLLIISQLILRLFTVVLMEPLTTICTRLGPIILLKLPIMLLSIASFSPYYAPIMLYFSLI